MYVSWNYSYTVSASHKIEDPGQLEDLNETCPFQKPRSSDQPTIKAQPLRTAHTSEIHSRSEKMSGIPVYTQSPINTASKPSGTTPQTTAPQAQLSPSAPNPAPATTTGVSVSSYPPAQPGAAAIPAPTAAAQRYAPLQPTPTTQTQPEGPPAPKPGAVPTPTSRNTIPPPPRAGETYHPPQQTAAPTQPTSMPQTYPPQMSIPPPTNAIGAQAPASSTNTTNKPSSSYPVALPSGEYGAPRRSLEHPPGYHQNVYASEQMSEQRRAQEASNASGLGGVSTENTGGIDSDSMWDTAKTWAAKAGEKISEAEAEVWRKINQK